MPRQWGAFHACLLNGALLIPSALWAQQSAPISIAAPAPMDEASIQNWSKRVTDQINETWSESNNGQRQRKLKVLAETSTNDAAFGSRALRQTDLGLRTAVISALRDVTGTLRRVSWRSDESEAVQKTTAGWMVLVPDLIAALSDKDANADLRRQVGKTLIDLAMMSRDPITGSDQARKIWQNELGTLSELTRYPKTTVRLVTLNVLEALAREGTLAKPAVVRALADPDRFVRWSAIHTLEAMGLDQSSMLALAALQRDVDVDVQKSAIATLQALPGGTEALAMQHEAPPLKNELPQGNSSKTTKANANPLVAATNTTPPTESPSNNKKIVNKLAKPASKTPDSSQPTTAVADSSAATVDSLAKAKSASGLIPPSPSAPSREDERLAQKEPPIITPKAMPGMAMRRAPEAFSVEIAELTPTPNSTTKQEAAKLDSPVISTPVVQPDAPPRVAAPTAAIPQLPALTGSAQMAPESLNIGGSDALPLWTPPARVLKSNEIKTAPPTPSPAPVKPTSIQPISAQITVPETTPKVVKGSKSADFSQQLMTDILKLNSARVADQIEGIRSLGKLGPKAADAVPPLAEKLVKGEALVRREVPLALMQIGASAKLAQSVLERALDDQDTEVRVNAARALLELSDK